MEAAHREMWIQFNFSDGPGIDPKGEDAFKITEDSLYIGSTDGRRGVSVGDEDFVRMCAASVQDHGIRDYLDEWEGLKGQVVDFQSRLLGHVLTLKEHYPDSIIGD